MRARAIPARETPAPRLRVARWLTAPTRPAIPPATNPTIIPTRCKKRGKAVTRSSGTPMTPFDVLAQAVTAHATRSAKKLRQHGLVARTLTVFFHTNSRIAAIGFT
ncbi:hypothetical protein ACFOM8_21740 [Paracoccus angustae]|uniref:DNA polymerase Y-family little finger domain-containing protein n=1 Tax=Paracoccus angustae TaxID=1671480 RepID=A0ABV7UAM1_9RHOB